MNTLVKIASLALLLIFFSVGADAKRLKLATLAPAGTTWMKEMKAGADLIAVRTGGRVKLKFYPGGVMGNDQSVHRKIKIGQLHGGGDGDTDPAERRAGDGFVLDQQAVGHDGVRHGEGVRVAEVHFVLAGGGLVMAEGDADAHLFEGHDG